MCTQIVCFCLVIGFGSGLHGIVPVSQVNIIIVGKGLNHFQDSAAGPMNRAPAFVAFVPFDGPLPLGVSAHLEVPLVGEERERVFLGTEEWELEFWHEFSPGEFAAFEERFPDGVYDITVDFGDSQIFTTPLTIQGGYFPNTPTITNTGWGLGGSGGPLIINAQGEFTLSWDPFEAADESVALQFVMVSADRKDDGMNGSDWNRWLDLELPGDSVSVTFNPDGTMFYTDDMGMDHVIDNEEFIFEIGAEYSMELVFVNVVDIVDDFGSLGGFFDEQAAGIGVYFSVTEFDTLAIPEPSTYALFGVGLAVLFVVMRRRRR